MSWWLSGGILAASCIAAYQPKGAASYAASKVNLANPGTYDATEGVAPDWDAVNGWKFDGINDYLDTGVLGDTITSSGSIIFRYNNYGLDDTYVCGCSNDVAMQIRFRASQDSIYFWWWGNATRYYNAGTTGSHVLAAANRNPFVDAVDLGTNDLQTGTIPYSMYIGGSNAAGSLQPSVEIDIQAFALYNIDISSYISALTTAMNAL